MKIGKPDTIIRKTVNVGRADFTAKAADVREAQVVSDDDEEIRTRHDQYARNVHSVEDGMKLI